MELQWYYSQIKPLSPDFNQSMKQLRQEAAMSIEELIKSERYKEFFFYVDGMELNWLHELRETAVRLSDTTVKRLVEFKIDSLMTPWSNRDKADLVYWAKKKDWNFYEVFWFLKRTPGDCAAQYVKLIQEQEQNKNE